MVCGCLTINELIAKLICLQNENHGEECIALESAHVEAYSMAFDVAYENNTWLIKANPDS